MRMRWMGITVLLLLSIASVILAAGVPRSFKEIPLYAGAVRDLETEEHFFGNLTDANPENVRSHEQKVYRVNTIIDDVFKFYIAKLDATYRDYCTDYEDYEEFLELFEYGELEPGAILAPRYATDFYADDFFEDEYEYDMLIKDGKWLRSAFEGRPQWEKGRWLAGGGVEWLVCLDNGDLVTFNVGLLDVGYDSLKKIDYRSTWIVLDVLIEKSPDAMDEEWDLAMDDTARQFAQNPPTEAYLGIPFYPGWVYAPEISAGMSMDNDYHYYVFFSNDAPAKVAEFYQQRLNQKPSTGGGFYIFALKGNLPIPDEGLVIQLNTGFKDMPQTIITVQKMID